MTNKSVCISLLFISMFPVKLYAGSLDSYFAGVKTITADFTQILVHGENEQVTKGLIYIVSPNKFRLDYQHPYKQLYIADGQSLLSYDEDLEQLIIKPQGDVLSNSPAMVLSNPKMLDRDYKVEFQGKWDGAKWYLLSPKRADTNFEQIRLAFKDNKLITMELKDSFGQFNRLSFTKVKYNSAISATTFKFTPPAGVDVIKE
ncbi:MAG: outer membrane lipoprotein chaperone LolA [Gammaproteobacteria bacterium]|nr:outer membrane lipoprotein chaperone LolA [Gammaproteobacteria bacterium]